MYSVLAFQNFKTCVSLFLSEGLKKIGDLHSTTVCMKRKHHVLVASTAKGCCKILCLSCSWRYHSSWVYFNLRFGGCTSVTPVKSGSGWWVGPGDGSPFLQEKDGAHFLSTPRQSQEGPFSGAERSLCSEEVWEADIHLFQNCLETN